MQLRVPGPTPCPNEVLLAMSKQMVNHRGKEFGEINRQVTAGLKEVFQTKEDVLILTCAGTGGLEAAVVNSLSPGDKVLSLCNGVFAERFANIAEQYGAEVKRLQFEWGKAVEPDKVRQALRSDPAIKAVLVTHNETSTAVTSDLGAVSRVVKEFDKLLLVDAVSSLSSINLPVDAWQCDVVVSASQKGWMIPPGLAMVSVSQRGWQAHKQAKMPRFYLDFTRAKNYLERGQTPWTPAVSIYYALATALELMKKEGLSNIFARHARVGKAAREGVKSLGLSLFPDEAVASNTVTAVNVPDGIEASKLLQIMREEHGIVLAGGQQKLEGKIFRIGHLGWVNESEIEEIIKVLRQALSKAGQKK